MPLSKHRSTPVVATFASLTSPPTNQMIVELCSHLYPKITSHYELLSVAEPTLADRKLAVSHHANLLYGELHPAGVSKLFDPDHANIRDGDVLLDLGCGKGKLCLQAFLQWTAIKEIVGIELSSSRIHFGLQAMETLQRLMPKAMRSCSRGEETCLLEDVSGRSMRLTHGSLFDVDPAVLRRATMVILSTEFSHADARQRLRPLLDALQVGTRMLTYRYLFPYFYASDDQCPFKATHPHEPYWTTWNHFKEDGGHPLHLWVKTR